MFAAKNFSKLPGFRSNDCDFSRHSGVISSRLNTLFPFYGIRTANGMGFAFLQLKPASVLR